MTEHPLKKSIAQRTEDERFTLKEEKKKPRPFNIQVLLIISIVIGLVFSLIRIINFFF